jgi:hypothetical protein
VGGGGPPPPTPPHMPASFLAVASFPQPARPTQGLPPTTLHRDLGEARPGPPEASTAWSSDNPQASDRQPGVPARGAGTPGCLPGRLRSFAWTPVCCRASLSPVVALQEEKSPLSSVGRPALPLLPEGPPRRHTVWKGISPAWSALSLPNDHSRGMVWTVWLEGATVDGGERSHGGLGLSVRLVYNPWHTSQ